MRHLVHQILKARRKQLGYGAIAIAKRIGLSKLQFQAVESGNLNSLDDDQYLAWLKHLDIPPPDHPWFLQIRKRDTVFMFLSKHFPNSNGSLISRVADTLALEEEMHHNLVEKLSGQLHHAILPLIYVKPRVADISIDE